MASRGLLGLVLLSSGGAAGSSASARDQDGAEGASELLGATPWEPPDKWTDAPGCQCCATPQRALDDLTRHCLGGTYMLADQVLEQESGGALTVTETVREKVCASPTCRGAILHFWSQVRGCSEVSSWRTVAMAWMSAKAQCSKVGESPIEGPRFVVLAAASFRSCAVNTSTDYSMRRAEAEVHEALAETLQSDWKDADERLQVSIAPLLDQAAEQVAERPTCVGLEGTWPSEDAFGVSDQLDFAAFFFSERVAWDAESLVKLRGQSAACAGAELRMDSGDAEIMPSKALLFRVPQALEKGCCYTMQLEASAVSSLDGDRKLCYDVVVDFCVDRDAPVPETKLVGDRWLRIAYNMPVTVRGQPPGLSLESKPLVKPGSPYHTALPFREQHHLRASEHMVWVYQATGKLLDTAEASNVVDNSDGTGKANGEALDCKYSSEADGGSAVACEDMKSFDVDMCAEKGRCSEAMELPCSLELKVSFPKGLVLGISGDRSAASVDKVRTRQCGPPQLRPSADWPNGHGIALSWSEPVKLVARSAKVWLCEKDTLEQTCHIKGETIDDVVNVSSEDLSKWTLRVPKSARPACGHLEVLIDKGAVQSRDSNVKNNETKTEIALSDECPRFLDPAESSCWLLWDDTFRFLGHSGPTGGSDNNNFRADLDDIGILYTLATDIKELWRRLEAKTYMPWCLVVPELVKDPAEGHERAFFDYVGLGGQLYVIGGRVNIDFMRSTFDIEMALTLSGNRQILEESSLSDVLHGSRWFPELPTLNQMACVSFPAMRGTTFGEKVVVHGIYSSREEISDNEEVDGYGLFEVVLQQGVGEYLAFDWHVDDNTARKKWATTLKLLLEGNRQRGHAPRRLQVYPAVAEEGVWTPPRRRRAALAVPPRRLQACQTCAGSGQDFELTVAFRCPSGLSEQEKYHGAHADARSCDRALDAVMQGLVDAKSQFHKGMEGRCVPLEMRNYSNALVAQAVSLCPADDLIEAALFDMNFACNFTESSGLSLVRFTNTTQYLEAHVVQTREGLETLDDIVRDKMCRRPICRRMVSEAYKLMSSCPRTAGHKGFIARVLAIARTALKSCAKVQSLGSIEEALAGAVAPSLFGLRGVASGIFVERSEILLSGINTISPEEMHFVQLAVEQIIGDKLGLLGASAGVDPWTTGLADALFGLKYGDITQIDAQVSASLEPAASDEAPPAEFGRLTGEEPIIQETTFTSVVEPEAKNLHVLSLQPRWGSHGVDPATHITFTFEDLIAKDDEDAVIRIFPTSLREVCLYLTEYGQFAFYPTETGKGGHDAADNDKTKTEFGVPVKFICQSYRVGDKASVVVSGEVLQIKPKYPLMRNEEYVVILPRMAVKASAFASSAFRGAMFNGWPGEDAPDDEEYIFTTGSPVSSNTKVSISVSCGSEADCAARRDVLEQEVEMEDVALRTQCFIAWYRCSSDTSSSRHCAQPQGMDWCKVHAPVWNATVKPAWSHSAHAERDRNKTTRLGGGGVLRMTGSTIRLGTLALLLCLPWWAWVSAALSWALCAFSGYRATKWICEVYRKSRLHDPYVHQVTRYLPFWATISVAVLVLLSGMIGAHAAESTYQRWVRPLSRDVLSKQSDEWLDVHYFRGRGLSAFTLAGCTSTALVSAVAAGATARFRMAYHDVGQASALASVALALVAALAAACGFVQGAGVSESVAMQTSFTWIVAAAMFCVGVAGVSTALLSIPLAIVVLYSRAGIGDIVAYACKFIFMSYSQWSDDSGPVAAWSGWVLHMRDIKGVRGFVQALARKRKSDGSVYLSFRVSDSPAKVNTRSIPLQQGTSDAMGVVYSFLGETVSLNIASPLTLVMVDVMFQQKHSDQPEKIASATWDPWVGALLDKCFENWKLCNPRNLRDVLWNPRDLLGSDSRPLPDTYVGFELNLSSDPVSYSPDMGILFFNAAHLGPFDAVSERDSPWDMPQRSIRMGDTIDGGEGLLRRRHPTEASAPFYSRVMYSQYGRLPRDLQADRGSSYLKSIAPGGSMFTSHRGGSHFWTH